MNNVILYTLDSKGKTRYWKASSDLKIEEEKITIVIEYGVLGSEKFIIKKHGVRKRI